MKAHNPIGTWEDYPRGSVLVLGLLVHVERGQPQIGKKVQGFLCCDRLVLGR